MNEVVDMIGKLSTGVSFAGEILVAPGHGPATAFAPRESGPPRVSSIAPYASQCAHSGASLQIGTR